MKAGECAVKINDAVRESQGNAVLCWLATASPDGMPNVSPKEIFSFYDDETLVVADIMSPNTVRNIKANPKVCASFIDVFRQKGFKLEGDATLIAHGEPTFEEFGKDLLAMAEDAFPIRHVIRIHIRRVSRILAPSYILFPGRTEEERIQSAYETYGVQPNP
jgi:predicted pyridoxine 5'-phosphate oxidase superfamily flavin-nucleotide-binding protein